MIFLTKNERRVLLFLGAVFLFGSILHYSFKKYPDLVDLVHVMEGDALYYKTNINHASLNDLQRIPYIGPATARRIIDYREEIAPFKAVDEVQRLSGVRQDQYQQMKHYLKVK